MGYNTDVVILLVFAGIPGAAGAGSRRRSLLQVDEAALKLLKVLQQSDTESVRLRNNLQNLIFVLRVLGFYFGNCRKIRTPSWKRSRTSVQLFRCTFAKIAPAQIFRPSG